MASHITRPSKPAAHLVHLLTSTKNHHPNFVLFLGAGASAESGVKTANEMIEEWRAKYTTLYANGDPAIISKQSWHNTTSEYSHLFEALYDQPSQRREYIENCLETANPSWGYIYLVDLIRRKSFNTIFTTNFDDLLNEACYLYSSDIRPIVCAHDSSIRSIRITTKRPKIIKLHGDFLFDSIKNTLRELESLETNMRDKLKQYAAEFGMIVIGYSGRDRSIMDSLDALMRNDDCFPHGIYWCIRKGDEITDAVDHLRRFPRFHLIEIQGFNGLFSELHHALADNPHPIFNNPFGVASDRFTSLLSTLQVQSREIRHQCHLARDISTLGTSLQKPPESFGIEMPHQILAWLDVVQKNYPGAIAHISKEIKRNLTSESLNLAIDILRAEWSDELAENLVATFEKSRTVKSFGLMDVNEIAVLFILNNKYDLAERTLVATEQFFQLFSGMPHDFFRINQAQLFRHRGVPIPEKLGNTMLQIIESGDLLSKFGALVVLEAYEEAVVLVEGKQQNGVFSGCRIDVINEWPITRLLPAAHQERFVQLAKAPTQSQPNTNVILEPLPALLIRRDKPSTPNK